MKLKNIKLGALPRLDFDDRNKLPNLPGVYIVLYREDPIYVGKGKSLSARWTSNSHHRWMDFQGIQGVQIAWITMPVERIEESERRLINIIQPIFNQGIMFNRAPCLADILNESGEIDIPDNVLKKPVTVTVKIDGDALVELRRRAKERAVKPNKLGEEIALAALLSELTVRPAQGAGRRQAEATQ